LRPSLGRATPVPDRQARKRLQRALAVSSRSHSPGPSQKELVGDPSITISHHPGSETHEDADFRISPGATSAFRAIHVGVDRPKVGGRGIGLSASVDTPCASELCFSHTSRGPRVELADDVAFSEAAYGRPAPGRFLKGMPVRNVGKERYPRTGGQYCRLRLYASQITW
jgi:hypothetical protein